MLPTESLSRDAARVRPSNRSFAYLLLLSAPLAAIAPACGDDDDATDYNAEPAWLGAPTETLLAGQGRSLRVAFTPEDPEGDALTVRLEGPEGVALEHDTEAQELVVRPSYGVTGTIDVKVALEDGTNPAVEYVLRIEVAELGWTDLVSWPAGSAPEAREHASVVVDDASGSAYVLFGSGYAPYLSGLGDGARFDVATKSWSPLTMTGDVPLPGGSKRFAGARGAGAGYLHGGYVDGGPTGPDTLHRVAVQGDTVSYTEIAQSTTRPSARSLHVFAYDPGSDTFMMFGGVGVGLLDDTWTMRIVDGVAEWTELELDVRPPGRFGAFYGVDEERGRLVLYSGQTGSALRMGDDVWVFDFRSDPPRWTELQLPATPPGRRNGTSVWDPAGEQLFVFGGTSDGMTTQPGLYALDARPGREAWSEVVRAGEPELRSSGFGAFVAGEGELGGAVWMGFGNSSTGVYRDFSRLGFTPP